MPINRDELEMYKEELSDIQEEIKKERGILVSCQLKSRKLDKEIESKIEDNNKLGAVKNRLIEDVAKLNKDKSTKEVEINRALSDFVEAQKSIDNEYHKLAVVKEEIIRKELDIIEEKTKLHTEIKRYAKMSDDLGSKVAEYNKKVDEYNYSISSCNDTESDYKVETAKCMDMVKQIESDRSKLAITQRELETNLRMVQEERKTLDLMNQRMADRQKEMNIFQDMLNNDKKAIDELKAKLEIRVKDAEATKLGFTRQLETLNAKEREIELKKLRVDQIVAKYKIEDEITKLEQDLNRRNQ